MGRKRDSLSQSDEHNARGIELADRGWLDEAVSEFQKAIDLDPGAAHARDNLATVLTEKGLFSEALVHYVDALKADPESPTAHHYLASFLAGHGHDLAIMLYRRAIDIDFEFPDAHLNLAMALAESGNLEEALVELSEAYKIDPEDELIHHELACCLIDLERYPEAIGHLKAIVKSHPEHVEAYVDLGIAYTAQGFYAEAENVLRKALDIDKHDFASHYHIAALYAAWDRNGDALEHLEVAAAHDREKLRAWLRDDRLFDSLRHEKQYAKLMT